MLLCAFIIVPLIQKCLDERIAIRNVIAETNVAAFGETRRLKFPSAQDEAYGLENCWRRAAVLRTAEFRKLDWRKRELRDRLAGVGAETCWLTDKRRREIMMKLTDRTLGSARARGMRR